MTAGRAGACLRDGAEDVCDRMSLVRPEGEKGSGGISHQPAASLVTQNSLGYGLRQLFRNPLQHFRLMCLRLSATPGGAHCLHLSCKEHEHSGCMHDGA